MASDTRTPPSTQYIPSPARMTEFSSERRQYKELQQENLRLKCLVAEQALYIRELEELLSR
jgi:hypothetical protein